MRCTDGSKENRESLSPTPSPARDGKREIPTAPNTTRYGMSRKEAEDLQRTSSSPDKKSDEVQTSTESYVADNRKLRIANMNEAEVMAYLDEIGCEAETIAATLAAKLDGHRLVDILTQCHPEAEQILLEDLQIARRVVRLAIIADAKEKESASSTERPRREANDILRMRFAPYPTLPELTPAQLCFIPEQWKTHGVKAAGLADIYDEELAEVTTTLFENPEADISDLGQAMSPLQVHMDKLVENMLTEIHTKSSPH